MTERGETGQDPRIEAWRFPGAAALSDERYDLFYGRLHALADEFGLTPRALGQTSVVGIVREAMAIPLDRPAAAETQALPTALTKDDLLQHARVRGTRQTPEAYTNGLWNALLRLVEDVKVAKGEMQPVRSLSGDQIKLLKTFSITDHASEIGREAIDLPSLYDTLSLVLARGNTEASSLPAMGSERLDFLASFVNDRLQLAIPLPLKGETASRLDPLPPRSPRMVNVQSPYIRLVKEAEQEGSAEEQTTMIVSGEDLREFAADLGVAPSATEHFLAVFDGIADYCAELPSGRPKPRSPHWINRDVLFMKMRLPRGGDPHAVWGIRLETFVDMLYKLEGSVETRRRIGPYELQVRKLVRHYLDTVAPYTPNAK